jgi:hypothetical protein
MNRYFRCLLCCWVDELPERPKCCTRCKHKGLQEVTDHIGILLDSGEVRYCEACQKIHTR